MKKWFRNHFAPAFELIFTDSTIYVKGNILLKYQQINVLYLQPNTFILFQIKQQLLFRVGSGVPLLPWPAPSIHFIKILSLEMGLVPLPFTDISNGTECIQPITTGRGWAF